LFLKITFRTHALCVTEGWSGVGIDSYKNTKEEENMKKNSFKQIDDKLLIVDLRKYFQKQKNSTMETV
jgi:hypothetical protein